MNRLTQKNAEGYSLLHDGCPKLGDCYDSADCVDVLVNRLGVYEDAEESGRLLILPCPLDSAVYRICPKCNDLHDGSCKHCAWNGTGGISGCDVFGLWNNGQYPADQCTIVAWRATWRTMPIIIKELGRRVFLTHEEAENKLAELRFKKENGK